MFNGKIDPKQGLLPFTIIVTFLSLLLYIYLYLGRGPDIEVEGFRKELAEVFGGIGGYALALVYGRSILKMVVNDGTLLQRFIPEDYHALSASTSKRLLSFLNRTHKHVGAAAVGMLLSHATLSANAKWNLFLEMLLFLIAWQGLFGLFLVVRIPPAALKRYGYLVHAQLFSGITIGIFAIFGHLLV